METATPHSPPAPQPRPELDGWLRARNIKPVHAARDLGVSKTSMNKYLLPFCDARRQVPGDDKMAAIVSYTGGEITCVHFYPPHLRPRDPDIRPPSDAAQRPADEDWQRKDFMSAAVSA